MWRGRIFTTARERRKDHRSRNSNIIRLNEDSDHSFGHELCEIREEEFEKAVTLAMKDALVKEVERKLVAKRESCGDSEEELKQFNHGQKRSFEKLEK